MLTLQWKNDPVFWIEATARREFLAGLIANMSPSLAMKPKGFSSASSIWLSSQKKSRDSAEGNPSLLAASDLNWPHFVLV
jgi:hypothetical protein